MDREFLRLFNAELRYLNDHAAEFAEEFPGIAERLGGLVQGTRDPMISGLLEGCAFLAARVQLKLKHEFQEFTFNYLEQILPDHLSPTPSALLASVTPGFGDPALRKGQRIERGALMDATYVERDRRVACRFQLRSPITLWPFEMTGAAYLPSQAAVRGLAVSPRTRTLSGVSLSYRLRTAASPKDEPEEPKSPDHLVKGCSADSITLHFTGPEAECVSVYEQMLGNATGVWLRFEDKFGEPIVIDLGPNALTPVGFDEEDLLIPENTRVFRGFHVLREYFWFPHKYLGVKIGNLQRALHYVETNQFEIIIGFAQASSRLSQIITRDFFAPYAAPAVNLFRKSMDRMFVADNRHEFHVVPDRTHPLDFEPFRIEEAYAHFAGGKPKVPIRPLYTSAGRRTEADSGLYYTVRRLPRKRSSREERVGYASSYAGTELFLSVSEPEGTGFTSDIAQISLRGLCSNRHLTEQLPVGEGGVDFRLANNIELDIACVAGPTPPRPPVVSYREAGDNVLHSGASAWRLINFVSLNQLALSEDDPQNGAKSLRSLLELFCDPTDMAARRRIDAIRSVSSRPIVRRVTSAGGIGAARGLEITVTVEEAAFEGSGAYLLGAILNVFFAEYVSINRFTQTVLRSVERGEIKRWPPVFGHRPNL